MKKLALAAAAALYATAALAQVSGSPHDFTDGFTGNTFTATADSCTFCHAPHNANAAQAGAPLWNRATNTQVYTMYNSATIDGARSAAPGVNSLTCLQCHDGQNAIAVTFGTGNLSGTGNTGTLAGTPFSLGTTVANDHPIGVNYDPVADVTLRPIATPVGLGFRLYNYGGAALNNVECGTCHDPHNNTNGSFLRVPNTTGLCGACHTQ